MTKINETAAGGSTGAGSIATVPSNRLGAMQARMSLKDFMLKFHSGVTNRYKFKFIGENIKGSISKITETAKHPYQLDDATSRLKNIQSQGEHEDTDVITFGVQDDSDNIMLITVPLEQGEEFERRVAQALADVVDYKKTGKGEDKSLAELLYELKDEFTVIDAQFPTIPRDAVYNADEITKEAEGDFDDDVDNEFSDDGEDDLGGGDDLGDDEMGDTGSPDADGEFDPDDEEIGDDFDSGPESKEDLLTAVLGMLKSQNEKETAQARAQEEEAKARQAELAVRASKEELETQESMIAAQAEMDAEKDREKKAKEMAELAKFNYKKKKGLSEGFSPLFKSTLLELDSNDTVASLRRQRAVIASKYKVTPEDSEDVAKHKRDQHRYAMRELQTEIRAAKKRETFNNDQADKNNNNEQL